MVSYIYKIVSPHTRRVYIGSTIQNPKKRFSCHRTYYRNGCDSCSSYEIFIAGDANYEILETVPEGINHKTIERKYVEQYGSDVVVNYYYTNRPKRRGPKIYKKRKDYVSPNLYYVNRSKLRVNCLCGTNVALQTRKPHYKTKKHRDGVSKLFLGVNNQT
jgi:hypothetical protein